MFQERIRENYEALTPGFRKLADFIMNSTLDVAFLTATELSRRVGVDPATVVRFAQEIGYSGFRELSREIKRYVRNQVTATTQQVQGAESVETLLATLMSNDAQNLQHFMTTDTACLVQAIEVLRVAPRLWFTGEFSGYEVAAFVAKQFQMYGISALAFQPSMGETATHVLQMEPGDALVAFAGNDPSVDTGYAIRMAKAKGVKTIAVTGSGVILPAREADIAISVSGKSPSSVPTFGTRMQVLSLLWEAVMVTRVGNTARTLEEALHNNMERLRKLRAETPEYEVGAPQEIA